MTRIEMAGKTFNSLHVIEQAGLYKEQEATWRCLCSCGKETIVRGYYLRSGHTKTCGNCSIYTQENDYMKCTVKSNRFFVFNIDDYDLVRTFHWSVDKLGYVLTNRNNEHIKLHRLLMNPDRKEVVDHINGLPWDCRIENLRVTSQRNNTCNKRLSKASTTGYKGVCFDKRRSKYMAVIHPNRRTMFLGYYDSAIEAAIAYNNAASFHFGEYARLNTIPNMEVSIFKGGIHGKQVLELGQERGHPNALPRRGHRRELMVWRRDHPQAIQI